ncbi:hypothetical protein L1887_43404 [Cichorium endivia]|nr:hypothetical protein L1887_43404 [Cichorium endivia]
MAPGAPVCSWTCSVQVGKQQCDGANFHRPGTNKSTRPQRRKRQKSGTRRKKEGCVATVAVQSQSRRHNRHNQSDEPSVSPLRCAELRGRDRKSRQRCKVAVRIRADARRVICGSMIRSESHRGDELSSCSRLKLCVGDIDGRQKVKRPCSRPAELHRPRASVTCILGELPPLMASENNISRSAVPYRG